MREFSLLIKPVSFDCNMACDYCFYRRAEDLYGRGAHRMSDAVLEAMVGQMLGLGFPTSSFCWQGGEPLAAGLPFFRKVVAAQSRLGRPRQVVANAVQTNGVLIDAAWASFFRRYNFLVGVSLDGPAEVHDVHRRTADRRSTYERTLAGIAELRRREVEFNVLCVVSDANVRRGADVFNFFLSQDLRHLQFIPAIESPQLPAPLPQPPTIDGAAYGDFLCAVFDAWRRCAEPRPCVRLFDAIVEARALGRPRFCVMAGRCDSYLLVEHTGDIFPCDFYAYPEWRLGNVLETPLGAIYGNRRHREFAARKSAARGDCGDCRWWSLCHGGCVRDREALGGGVTARSPLCTGLRRFFDYAMPELDAIAARLRMT
jgi:uncharacterized protein